MQIKVSSLSWRLLTRRQEKNHSIKKWQFSISKTKKNQSLNFSYFERQEQIKTSEGSYVYWTVHHLDSWIKRDQLDFTCFIISLFNVQHVSDVNTSILRSLRLICWVISWVVLLWFDVCWCYVVVWLWWCGVHMQAEACIRIPHHHSQTTT